MMIDDVLDEARYKMEATLSVYREELGRMRSGRASTALVNRLVVEYYGQDTELRGRFCCVQSLGRPFAITLG